MRLYHRIKGKGEPVILLHGLFGSADNLGALARSLEEDYRVISVDLRSHGRSDHAADMSYPLMAGDILRLMDELGLETCRIFGHSMGGKVAMQAALMAPKRIEKLVVGDIAPVPYGRHHDRILEGMDHLAIQKPESRQEAGAILTDYIEEDAVLSFILTNWRKQDDGQWGWRLNLSSIVSEYHHIVAGNSGEAYTGQVLFLRGGLSDYIRAEHRDDILALFPRASVRTVEGAGHWLHAEKPDMVARIVKKFFKE